VGYSIAPSANATGYLWSTTGDISLNSGQNTTSATFDFGPTFTTGTVRVQATNACGASGVRSLAVRALPPTPGLISGNLTSIVKNTSETYTINPVPGATSYEWVIDGGGITVNAQIASSIELDIDSTFITGKIRVRAGNACGFSAYRSANLSLASPKLAATTRNINIFPNPATNKVTIQSEGISSIILYDVSGRVMQAQQYQSEYQIELGLNYPSGIYFIEIAGEGWREVRKLVVE
jgi:hypothetical protein